MKRKLNMEPKLTVIREKIPGRAHLLEDTVIKGIMLIAGTEIKVVDFGASDDPVTVTIDSRDAPMLKESLVTTLPRDMIMMNMTDCDWIFTLNNGL